MLRLVKKDYLFVSIQGEGKVLGRKSLFLRLYGCNLKCKWCDTKYSWKKKNFIEKPVENLRDEILKYYNEIDFLVVTGGEPMLQQIELFKLLLDVSRYFNIVIETNGTIPLHYFIKKNDKYRKLLKEKIIFSISPKEYKFVPSVIEEYFIFGGSLSYLKIVVGKNVDLSYWLEERLRPFVTKEIYIQPLNKIDKKFKKMIYNNLIISNKYSLFYHNIIISCQLHKLLKIS